MAMLMTPMAIIKMVKMAFLAILLISAGPVKEHNKTRLVRLDSYETDLLFRRFKNVMLSFSRNIYNVK